MPKFAANLTMMFNEVPFLIALKRRLKQALNMSNSYGLMITLHKNSKQF